MRILSQRDRGRNHFRDAMQRRFGAAKMQEAIQDGERTFAKIKEAVDSGKDPCEEGWEGVRGEHGYRLPNTFEELGLRSARIIRATALASWENRSPNVKMERVVEILADVYGDRETADYLSRSLETTTPKQGGLFVHPRMLMNEFVTFLRSFAPIFVMGARRIPLGSGFTIPGMANGATSKWKGEKCYTRATNADFNTIKFTSHEIETKMCISNTLLREAEADVDSLVREDMLGSVAELLTATVFHGGVEPNSPLGLFNNEDIPRYSLPDAISGSAGGDLTETTPDLLTSLFMRTLIPMSAEDTGSIFGPAVWYKYRSLRYPVSGERIFNADMNEGMLEGWPFALWSGLGPYAEEAGTGNSADAPYDVDYDLHRYVFGKWSDLIVATDSEGAEVVTSDTATFTDADGNLTSAFDIGAVVIKMNQRADFGVRRNNSFMIVDNIRAEKPPTV